MSQAISYGQSFARKHLSEGNYEQALAAAEAAIAAAPADPEPMLDRAQVHLAMDRWEAAVADLEKTITLDAVAQIVDDDVLDDTLWSTVCAWAQKVAADQSPEAGVAILGRYRALRPTGGHGRDVDDWTRRLRGEKAMWRKQQDLE